MQRINYLPNEVPAAPRRVLSLRLAAIDALGEVFQKHGADFIIAWSGGKDSIVVAHLMREFGIRKAVCEVSFCFPGDVVEYRKISNFLGLETTFTEGLNDDWLKRNPKFIFPKMKYGQQFYAARQQATVKRAAQGHTGYITGRRTQENMVPSMCYTNKNGTVTVHPLRTWTSIEVWQYIKHFELPYPSIYLSPLGRAEGATPWCNINTSKYNRATCWKMVYDHDPVFFRNHLAQHYDEAREALKKLEQ